MTPYIILLGFLYSNRFWAWKIAYSDKELSGPDGINIINISPLLVEMTIGIMVASESRRRRRDCPCWPELLFFTNEQLAKLRRYCPLPPPPLRKPRQICRKQHDSASDILEGRVFHLAVGRIFQKITQSGLGQSSSTF